MPPFTKPFPHDYDLDEEKNSFSQFFHTRNIPVRKNNEIDLATWNIANLGVQNRGDKELELIAFILSHFDIIAIQEVNENLKQFNKIMKVLSAQNYRMIMTDSAGNSERLAVIYNEKIIPQELFGELGYNPNGTVKNNNYVIKPRKQSFTFQGKSIVTYFYNFNRNPFLSTWKVNNTDISFMLANVHIYYGDDEEDSAQYKNRIAEVYYLSNWAKEQRKKDTDKLYESNIILIGDMNIPKMKSSDTVYRALKKRGLLPTRYSTEAGSTIQEFYTYDQIVFSNERIEIVGINQQKATVVDFDNFIFQDLWAEVENNTKTLEQFKAWTKYAISDHRPLFVRLKV